MVSAVCGLIIVVSYLATLDRAKDNRKLASQRAVFKVLPEAKSVKDFFALPTGEIVPAGRATRPPARFPSTRLTTRAASSPASPPKARRKATPTWCA